jgi:hypothetical protein
MGADKLPDSIKDTDDSFANKIVNCSLTGKPFRILLNELTFHRQYNLPLPRLHPDQRHKVRLARRNPRKLWDRNCSKCGMGIKTTYGPDTTQRFIARVVIGQDLLNFVDPDLVSRCFPHEFFQTCHFRFRSSK